MTARIASTRGAEDGAKATPGSASGILGPALLLTALLLPPSGMTSEAACRDDFDDVRKSHLWEGAPIVSNKIGEEKTIRTSEFISPVPGHINGIRLNSCLGDAMFGLKGDADMPRFKGCMVGGCKNVALRCVVLVLQ